MESKRHPVNLKQYRKMKGKWQFVPVVRDAKGMPDPRLILVHGQPVSLTLPAQNVSLSELF